MFESTSIDQSPDVKSAPPSLIDTHAHLDLFKADEVDGVVAAARQAGVEEIISVAVDVESAERAIAFAHRFPGVFATIGVHPNETGAIGPDTIDELKKLGRDAKVVGVGETGLDYFRQRSPKETQVDAFKRHIELANELSLPLMVHCRDAYDDLATILSEFRPEKVVLHCFSGGPAELAVFLDLGCHISFAGQVTFKNADALRDAAARIPLDRLFLETDSPYLAPEPHRGRQNEPAYVALTAAKIAEVKGLPLEKVAAETTANARRFFDLEKEKGDRSIFLLKKQK